ncbi:MarR family winged helix-turn-helix transcriptional regulator [Cellulomonas oligotrophica]|uniref:DNA-binding MarR family transcriptional regulator n=1 Tax=Cellulomonas oligotrophica TaxID=931536 RepID=A0A7Y9FEW8_9CELL|nr:MarR family winged helix-turn-helix transcriptional regulator [Cellulomonas oligotrophica]NYD86063.1 DNA-binding MarR family transcriptional regulator [Cellulomonas oligotrophica]GIG30930.1 hypothetical protein Col01nite_00890 [Cellulomonas oligotrophica]
MRAVDTSVAAEDDLGWQLGSLLARWRDAVGSALADVPQGPRGYHVLRAVAHGAPPTQGALAASLGIDRTVMTYLVDRLVGCDLVERQPDPADRRARRVVATAAGREVLDDLEQRIRAAEEQVLAGLDPDERRVLRRLLARTTRPPQGCDEVCAVVDPSREQPDPGPGVAAGPV